MPNPTQLDRNIEKIRTLVPDKQLPVEQWSLECHNLGIPFYIAEARRTQEQQDIHYLKGRSAEEIRQDAVRGRITFADRDRLLRLINQGRQQRGAQVTWTLRSKHMTGLAVDVYPVKLPPEAEVTSIRPGDTLPMREKKRQLWALDEIAEVAEKYGIIRPKATLDLGDYGHFELDKAKPVVEDVKHMSPEARLRRLKRQLKHDTTQVDADRHRRQIEALEKRMGVDSDSI